MARRHDRRRCVPWVAALALCAASAWAADRTYPDAESVQPLPVGATIPAATVRTIAGDPVELATRVRERGALLVFYRGGW
jgi:hypothetical protein